MLTKHSFLLPLVIVVAFLLRIAFINQYPPSLNWDEVSHGYNAYSILQTGKDEWGATLPLIFRAYGDYKLPVYIYTSVPFVATFGLTALAVRLPSILAGTLAVLFTYLLVKEIFRKSEQKHIALISAFLMAVSPWSWFLSRIAVEANLALMFIIAGVYFFLVSLRSKGWYLILSIVFLGLSVWTYNSARIFIPLLVLIIGFIYKVDLKKIFQKQKSFAFVSTIVLTVFLLPMFIQLVNPVGGARYENVKILDSGTIARIEQNRNISQLPSIMPRLIHNKVTYFSVEFTKNYISHFSPQFLFVEGGDHYQFSVPGWGLLYFVNLPLFLIGIFILGKGIKQKSSQLLFAWLLLAPIASSLTREAPHALRAIVMLPIPIIIIAVGFIFLITLVKNKAWIIWSFYILALLLGLVKYVSVYMDYGKDYSWAWQYGYKQTVELINEKYDAYDKIIVTKKYGEPHEFFLFYNKVDPNKFINDPTLIRFYQSNWYWVDRFDKFYFVNDWQIPQNGSDFVLESGATVDCTDPLPTGRQDCLLITGPGNAPEKWKLIDTINFLDGKPAFEIYEN